jgi:hypothetical protein
MIAFDGSCWLLNEVNKNGVPRRVFAEKKFTPRSMHAENGKRKPSAIRTAQRAAKASRHLVLSHQKKVSLISTNK